jgi:aspartate kinase
MSPPLSVNNPEMARALLKNHGDRGWVVQKFGGTSVGKFPDKIAEDIVKYDSYPIGPRKGDEIELTRECRKYLDNNRVVVVCSARSTGKKVTGTTSR